MEWILSIRDGIRTVYAKYETVIRGTLKFVMAFLTFILINVMLGQMPFFNNPLILAVLAVICVFLPSNSMLLFGMIMILFHFYGISLEAALAGGGMLVIVQLLYFSLAPKSAFPFLFGAIVAGINIPGAAAILLGSAAGPGAALEAGFGVLIYYLIRMVSSLGGNLQAASLDAADALMEKMIALINAVITNKEMMLIAGAVVLVTWVVMIVKSIPGRFSWMIAAVIGLIGYGSIRILGLLFLDIPFSPILFGVEVLLGLLAARVAQIFLFNLDFRKTEDVQFEDDEYYYYVKAVPKKKVEKRVRIRRAERR